MALVDHPAVFSDKILDAIRGLLADLDVYSILDPFAGTGRIHELRPKYHTIGVEREPEWAGHSPHTLVADTLQIHNFFPVGAFDTIVTSPCYGNRMADNFEARDDSRRHTYRHVLGRAIAPGSSCTMQWGDEYRRFHERAWDICTSLLPAYFILNTKDHIRNGKVQRVSQWHWETLHDLGWRMRERSKVEAPGNRHGENRELRVDHEWVVLFER